MRHGLNAIGEEAQEGGSKAHEEDTRTSGSSVVKIGNE